MMMHYLRKIVRENGTKNITLGTMLCITERQGREQIAEWNRLAKLTDSFPKWKFKLWKFTYEKLY